MVGHMLLIMDMVIRARRCKALRRHRTRVAIAGG